MSKSIWIEQRKNVFAPQGTEWALFSKFDEQSSWVITTWNKKPSEATVKATIELIRRSYAHYHSSLAIPPFNPKLERLEDVEL